MAPISEFAQASDEKGNPVFDANGEPVTMTAKEREAADLELKKDRIRARAEEQQAIADAAKEKADAELAKLDQVEKPEATKKATG